MDGDPFDLTSYVTHTCTGEGWTIGQTIRGGVAGFNEQMPAILSRAGVKVAPYWSWGAPGRPTDRKARRAEPALNAAWCFKNGMSEGDALKMITINSAEVVIDWVASRRERSPTS